MSLITHSVDLLKQHPLLGVGVGYDRILLAERMGAVDALSEAAGWYPHNIFLEMLLHYGLFIGGLLILLLLRIVYVTAIKGSGDASDLICVFAAIGFFPLLFSGSYLTSPEFFGFLGLCLYRYRNMRVRRPVDAEQPAVAPV